MDEVTDRYVPQLDGYRALAILLVLAMHFWRWPPGHPILTGIFGGGWIGVDLFFVLSGYLITRILLRDKERPAYYRNFYVRRALRIFPLGYAVMIFTLLVRPLISSDPDLLQSVRDSAWYLFYASNIVLAMRGFHGTLGVTWSLAVEEQFYLIWPALVRWLSVERMKALCIGIIVVAPVLRALVFPLLGWRWCFTFTPLRADAFAWGAVIALGSVEFFKRFARLILALSLAITVPALALGLFERELWWVSAVGYTITGMGAAAGLWLTLQARRGWLAVAPLRYVGKVSYGIYLLHGTCAIAVSRFFPVEEGVWQSIEFVVVGSAFSIGAATLSYRYFETPFLRLKDRFTSSSPGPVLNSATAM
jgi:peptidoglycan/LPS O-acetylase OafA/YrhL